MKIYLKPIIAVALALTFAGSAIATDTSTPSEMPAEAPAATPDSTARTHTDLLNFKVYARVDYQHEWEKGHTDDSNSGFEGKYLMFRADGEIIPGLTYSWRQRLNKDVVDGNFFDATDWIYLDYAYRGFNVAAGKQIVAVGGWEYDSFPLDLYSTSLMWENLLPFSLGVSGGYRFSERDYLQAQVVQSPFHTKDNRNMYAYSLRWFGKHGCWSTIWSANLMEYAKNKYISYIALGNKVDVDNVSLAVDFVNRAAAHQTFLFKDVSVIATLGWKPTPAWRVHAKYTYDVNRTNTAADLTVLPGTELNMIGGGLEYFPLLKNRYSLRLHGNCYYSWGTNKNAANVMQDGSTMLDFGVTWTMDVFSVKHK